MVCLVLCSPAVANITEVLLISTENCYLWDHSLLRRTPLAFTRQVKSLASLPQTLPTDA